MTKAEFLEKLRIELSSGVTPQVLQENLNYYSQYIDDEIRKGRTESEVLAELGRFRGFLRKRSWMRRRRKCRRCDL